MLERIPEYYVSGQCAQITLPFRNNITVLGADIDEKGILCHYNLKDDSQNVNKYLLDDRRGVFPYTNIPMYKGLFGRYYINQLFDYNKHYITFIDGHMRDRYLVKDGNEVVMLNRSISIPLSIRGNSCSSKDIEMFLMDMNALMIFDRYGRQCFYDRKYSLELDSFINNGGGLFVLKEDKGKIKIKIVRINNDIGYDNYIYREYDLPLNDYTVEELKCFDSKIHNINEPSVCSILNSNIERKEIREAKSLVRKLSNR